MKNKKTELSLILVLTIIISSFSVVLADSGSIDFDKEVLVLGEDLNITMVNDLKKKYGIDREIKQLIITNKEEHEALGKYIDKEIITNKSMSSAYIKLLDEGQGIKVETENINWVTEDMYANALLTAGVTDAYVKVIGPFPVSGTAALTGAMKAYEDLTGEVIEKNKKDVANDEMVTTAKLSDEIGKEKAEELITQVKIYIIENNITDEKKIKEVVEKTIEELGIKMDKETIESVTRVMKRISELDIDIDKVTQQLDSIVKKLDKIDIDTEQVKGILGKIFDMLSSIFNKLFK
ncbi:MAG TPA: DUF1002 domain-containing protein [Tissierellaceae bacterium]